MNAPLVLDENLLGHKPAVRMLRVVRSGLRFLVERFFAAAKNATPVAITLQHRSIHEGQTLNLTGCGVNSFDAFDSAVSSLCSATIARSTIVSSRSPHLPRLRSRRFFEVANVSSNRPNVL